jgi:hypothetical protein
MILAPRNTVLTEPYYELVLHSRSKAFADAAMRARVGADLLPFSAKYRVYT